MFLLAVQGGIKLVPMDILTYELEKITHYRYTAELIKKEEFYWRICQAFQPRIMEQVKRNSVDTWHLRGYTSREIDTAGY